MPSSQHRIYAVIMWIMTIFLSPIPGILLYLLKQNVPFLRQHAIQAIHLSLLFMILALISWILKLILIGFLLAKLISAIATIVYIYAAICAYFGKPVILLPKKLLLFS